MKRFVIGDIHGCVDELRTLIDALPLAAGDRVVFLGDYIDRGPHSKAVVEFLLSLQKQAPQIEFIFLKGNHEDMLLSFLGLAGAHGNMFLVNGGHATLASYGLSERQMASQHGLSAIAREHLEFYQRLQTYYLMEPFLCVHAGVHPQKSLSDQTSEDLLWIRNKFILSPHRLPQTVLFGHTPRQSVLYDLPYKVGLDTGLVYGNMLTCLEVDEKVLFQIGRRKRAVKRTSVQRYWLRSVGMVR